MTARLNKTLTIAFCALWVSIIFVDYLYYHPSYSVVLRYFQYFDTILVIALLGGLAFFINTKWSDHKFLKYLQGGIGVSLYFLLICATIIWTHYLKVQSELLPLIEGFTYLGKIITTLATVYFVYGTCYVLGALLLENVFSLNLSKRDVGIIKLGLGVSIFSLLLVILGFLGQLNIYIVLPIMLAILGIGWKATFDFLQFTLVKPLDKDDEIDWKGFVSFTFILILIGLNVLNNIRPVPFGFDALAVYLNLPNLIGQSGALVEGYSPYYWSLFISIGNFIFKQTEVVIALSVAGGILSLFVLYALCRKWLDGNYSLFIVLILYSLPIINYQSFRDVKTDLGLLFILLTAFLILINWLQMQTKDENLKKETDEGKVNSFLTNYLSTSEQLIVLLGILSGVALGIKLTALIFIFSTLSVFSYKKGGTIGVLTNFFLTFFIILVANIDTSLRAYHFGTSTMMWISLLMGLVGLGYWFYKDRSELFSLVKIVTVYVLFIGIFYIPWPIKNIQETGEISFKTLTEGRPIGIPKNVPGRN